MKKVSMLLFLIITGMSYAQKPSKKELAKEMEEANVLYSKKNYTSANEKFKHVLMWNPTYPNAQQMNDSCINYINYNKYYYKHIQAGDSLLAIGKYDKSMEEFNIAKTPYPYNGDVKYAYTMYDSVLKLHNKEVGKKMRKHDDDRTFKDRQHDSIYAAKLAKWHRENDSMKVAYQNKQKELIKQQTKEDSIQQQQQQVINYKNNKEKHSMLVGKYGKEYGESIFNHKVKVGMTKEMCIDAWGKPSDINTTTNAYGSHEQWVYNLKSYLYFDGDILTTIQN